VKTKPGLAPLKSRQPLSRRARSVRIVLEAEVSRRVGAASRSRRFVDCHTSLTRPEMEGQCSREL
jgi:hypothetical protein